MKTVHVVSAAVLAAALSALAIRYVLPPPAPPPHDHAVTTDRPPCHDVLGPGPRKAVVMVMWNRDEQCHLKTVPNRLFVCDDDELIWETSFIGRCRQHRGTLEIVPKQSTPELVVTPGPGTATGEFQERPCPADEYCHVAYTVKLTTNSGQVLEEDPHIEIW